MSAPSPQHYLLDIEGTVAPLAYVKDVMFPYVRKNLDSFLEAHWDEPEVTEAIQRVAREAGGTNFLNFTGGAPMNVALDVVKKEVQRLMDKDAKTTGLKELQGLMWRVGFANKELVATLYSDVAPALKRWKDAGRKAWIYSSGSIDTQKLFFRYTESGDHSAFLSGYFDTSTGPKKETPSYSKIVAALKASPAEICFISDIVDELNAARAAGLQTALAVRPGNAPQPDGHGHRIIESFNEL